MRTVRAFAREKAEADHFAGAVGKALDVEMRYGWSGALFQGALMAASVVTLGVTFWYGTLLAIEGDLTTGELNAFILYSINSAFGLALISGTFVAIVQALGASTRVFELLDRESGIRLDGTKTPRRRIRRRASRWRSGTCTSRTRPRPTDPCCAG